MFDFSQQRVLISGGTRGIGRGIAEAFLKAGATVVVTFVSNETSAKAMHEANALYGERLLVKRCDVTQPNDIIALFADIESRLGGLDILINNSGIREDAIVPLMSNDQWSRVIDTNLTGTFLMSREAVNLFLKNRYGRIINMSSIGGRLGLAGQANYAATKAGQIAMSKALAKEVAKKGITVNNVAPGFIDTELLQGLSDEQIKDYKSQVPMRRFGSTADVAHAVLFLASKEASYITGATLEVTGGL